MIIHGINKLTLLDYPGHTACTLFVGGCNFRCPFCQNGGLAQRPENEPVISDEEVFSFLVKRKRVLQGVCISGGEPTIQSDLIPFAERLRGLGYKVKLDTNGYRPEVLGELLERGLLDGVAMDIKSSPANYAGAAGLAGGAFDFARIERSAGRIMEYARLHEEFYYEFRTTMVRGLQNEEDMREVGRWLAGAERFYLQNYEDGEYVIDRSLEGFSAEEMERMAEVVRAFIPSAAVRGI